VDDAWRLMQQRLDWVFSRRIAFVVGATRWGTAVIERALDAHPEIAARGESHVGPALISLIGQALGHYRRRLDEARAEAERAGLPFTAAQLDAAGGVHLARAAFGLLLARYAGAKPAKCLVERTAEHVSALAELERLVPGAYYIHVVRDGRDEAAALWEHGLRTEGDAFARRHPSFARFAENFARAWGEAVAGAHAFGRRHPDRFLEVKCEHMLDRPTPTLSRVCRFLGVDWRESRIEPCVEAAAGLAPETAAGPWREQFDPPALAAFRRHAGEMLKLFDYED
jgi:hypothetical protein